MCARPHYWGFAFRHSGGTVQDVKVNGVSVVSGGVANIQKEVFEAEYGVTTFNDIRAAYNSGKIVVIKRSQWGDDFMGFLNVFNNQWADFIAFLGDAGLGSYLQIHHIRKEMKAYINGVLTEMSELHAGAGKTFVPKSGEMINTDTIPEADADLWDEVTIPTWAQVPMAQVDGGWKLVNSFVTDANSPKILHCVRLTESTKEVLIERITSSPVNEPVSINIGNGTGEGDRIGLVTVNGHYHTVVKIDTDTLTMFTSAKYAYSGDLSRLDDNNQQGMIKDIDKHGKIIDWHWYQRAAAPAGETYNVYTR